MNKKYRLIKWEVKEELKLDKITKNHGLNYIKAIEK